MTGGLTNGPALGWASFCPTLAGVGRHSSSGIHSTWRVPRHSKFAVPIRQLESLNRGSDHNGLDSLIAFLYLQFECFTMAQCHEDTSFRHWLLLLLKYYSGQIL